MMTTKAKLVAPESDVDKAKLVMESSPSVAAAIKTLAKEWGAKDRARISRALTATGKEVRYQWVRNVLTQVPKKEG